MKDFIQIAAAWGCTLSRRKVAYHRWCCFLITLDLVVSLKDGENLNVMAVDYLRFTVQ